MRGFKLISFGEFSYMCKGEECAEFQVLCTIDKPEPVSGWLHECKPSECKIWRGLSRAENRELSKTAPNKQSTPCVTCGALVPLSTVSCMECINP